MYVDNKKFDGVVDCYRTLLRTDAPTDIRCIGESAAEIMDVFVGDAGGIKIWRCNYESGIGAITVYHFFVHMDKPIEPNPPKKSSTTNPSK